MNTYLLVDFGSTYTKIIAVDIEKEVVLGRSQAPTTVESDIMIGFNNALSNLIDTCHIDINKVKGKYASSSAAGGLKMAAIGLVPDLTLEAARRAALGAGAKVVCNSGFEINEDTINEIESAKCDIVLLCGGTDGGNKDIIIHNARMLADSSINCPILVAGNRVVKNEIQNILEEKGKKVYMAENVLPSLDIVNVEPAQNLIREVFIVHIVKAKGLEKAQTIMDKPIIPTPKATLQAASLLADGTEDEPGIGNLLIVEVGGATTNIHTVIEQRPLTPKTVLKGLSEPRVKRTVEGDLGIRYNAHTIYDFVGRDELMSKLLRLDPSIKKEEFDIEEHIEYMSQNVGYVPEVHSEYNLDIALAESAVRIAVERHAGTVHKEFGIYGEVVVQHGKNLLETKNIIGTGGIFKYGLKPERVLRAALFSPETPWSLKPKAPNAYIDCDYLLYGIGLLAQDFPAQALRIIKKYLKPTLI